MADIRLAASFLSAARSPGKYGDGLFDFVAER